MNTVSRTLSGIGLSLLGAYIAFTSFVDMSDGWFFGVVCGIVILALGIYIFFNKKEDDIEQLKK